MFDLFVTDYLNVTANHSGWDGVTFGNLLNMMPGVGDADPDPTINRTFADENNQNNHTWNSVWLARLRDDKLLLAFRYGDYPWGPGEIVRYNTVMTFVLGAAMDSYYKTMAGPDANVWNCAPRIPFMSGFGGN